MFECEANHENRTINTDNLRQEFFIEIQCDLWDEIEKIIDWKYIKLDFPEGRIILKFKNLEDFHSYPLPCTEIKGFRLYKEYTGEYTTKEHQYQSEYEDWASILDEQDDWFSEPWDY